MGPSIVWIVISLLFAFGLHGYGGSSGGNSDGDSLPVRHVINAELISGTGIAIVTFTDKDDVLKLMSNQMASAELELTSDTPDKPINVFPADNGTNISITPTLSASAFNDTGGHLHKASQWQIVEMSNDSYTPVFDSLTDAINKTSITISSGILSYEKWYFWRVRYQCDQNIWSTWSVVTSFQTSPSPRSPIEHPYSTAANWSNFGCFIATAAYGSYLDPHVIVLRNFRDRVLMTSSIGMWFVGIYYKFSPPIAETIKSHELLRTMTRVILTPLVYTLEKPISVGFIILIGAGLKRSSFINWIKSVSKTLLGRYRKS